MVFFDEAKIHVKAGDGGNGIVAFRREKFVPFGGPCGGNGGRGGHIFLVADAGLNTLIAFKRRQHFRAERGMHGGGKNKQGRNGQDLRIPVPVGTVVRDAETGELLADLVADGQEVIVAHAGKGGRGNAVFATPTNQAPRFAEKGEPGEERWLRLELKLIADVGIVGLPNAGKSTLLSVVSAARPKIADYPFTTLTPNLGVVEIDNHTFVLADIPGLIEGAHAGAGLGHQFLRHIERTRLIIHLLDGASANPLVDFEVVNRELELYSPRLAAKPQIVVLNKLDLPEAQAAWPRVQAAMNRQGLPVLAISAVTGQGVPELLRRIVNLLAELPELEPFAVPSLRSGLRLRAGVDEEPIPVLRQADDANIFEIERAGPQFFRVHSPRLERLARITDWDNDEAVARFQRVSQAMGVDEALAKAGASLGDTVAIGEVVELEWQ